MEHMYLRAHYNIETVAASSLKGGIQLNLLGNNAIVVDNNTDVAPHK